MLSSSQPLPLNSTSLKKACKSTIEELGLKENKANMDMFEYEIPLALSELHPMIYEKYFIEAKILEQCLCDMNLILLIK